MAEQIKPHIGLAIIGHVDHGKSTLVGRLLVDTGRVSGRELEKLKEEAHRLGKNTFELAYVTDDLPEERAEGVTKRMQIKEFSTPRNNFTIADAPGHPDYFSNMIRGTRQADAAVLVVDAAKGMQLQTREHMFVARTMGIEQIIVAINKMDQINPPYNQPVFESVSTDVEGLLNAIGYKSGNYSFVPVSGFKGDNVASLSGNMAWYHDKTLVQRLDGLKAPTQSLASLPLRWPIHDIKKVPGIGLIPVGFIQTGTMKLNDVLLFMPLGKIGIVKSMQVHHQDVSIAYPGDPVGIRFSARGDTWEVKDLRNGHVAGLLKDPPTVAEQFTAKIMVLNHPGIYIGYAPSINIHEANAKCAITELVSKIDPSTGQIVTDHPDCIRTGDAAIVKFKPYFPLIVEPAERYQRMGRFLMRDSLGVGADKGGIVGGGIVLEVKPKIDERVERIKTRGI